MISLLPAPEQQSTSLGGTPMWGRLWVLVGDTAGGCWCGGTQQGGCMVGGSHQHLLCHAWQRLGLVHCRHPQSQADSPWDGVKMHYFHLLAADKRPRAACLCWLALRQAEQTQPASSALGQDLGSFCGGTDVLLPLPARQPPLSCGGQLALLAWQGDLSGTYIQISVFETHFL